MTVMKAPSPAGGNFDDRHRDRGAADRSILLYVRTGGAEETGAWREIVPAGPRLFLAPSLAHASGQARAFGYPVFILSTINDNLPHFAPLPRSIIINIPGPLLVETEAELASPIISMLRTNARFSASPPMNACSVTP